MPPGGRSSRPLGLSCRTSWRCRLRRPLAPRWRGAEGAADAGGVAAWILIEDRVHNTTATTKNTISVAVSLAGHTIAGSPRTVDMATSHLESFVATPLGGAKPGTLRAAHFALRRAVGGGP